MNCEHDMIIYLMSSVLCYPNKQDIVLILYINKILKRAHWLCFVLVGKQRLPNEMAQMLVFYSSGDLEDWVLFLINFPINIQNNKIKWCMVKEYWVINRWHHLYVYIVVSVCFGLELGLVICSKCTIISIDGFIWRTLLVRS